MTSKASLTVASKPARSQPEEEERRIEGRIFHFVPCLEQVLERC